MLPLSDRLLMQLSNGRGTARQLAQAQAGDVFRAHRMLRALEHDGLVEEMPVPCGASLWRLAPGVRVVYHPARIEVTSASARSTLPEVRPADACRAATDSGRRCRLKALRDGLCCLHAPRRY
jgi:hypothetical protein